MKDLMRTKKVVSKRVIQPNRNIESGRSYIETNEIEDELRACKPKSHPYVQCDCDKDRNDHCNKHHCNCECNSECCDCKEEDCTDNCFPNPCPEECAHPLIPPKFPISQAVLFPIETNRIFDTIMFRVFTDGKMANGEDLDFDFELGNLRGPLPTATETHATIERVCINYSSIRINPGTTSLENLIIEKVNRQGRRCETIFEYDVCGQLNRCCNEKCLGQNVVYKQRGLNVIVKDLEIELIGRFGCSEFTATATPVSKWHRDDESNEVVFFFNTLSSDLVVPADGRGFTLRQDFQTQLTVDCIGKAIITQEMMNNKPCFELDIPNGIDLVLCLQNIVSALIEEQIVVLGAPRRIRPRLVDTFGNVCDFSQFDGKCEENNHFQEDHNHCHNEKKC